MVFVLMFVGVVFIVFMLLWLIVLGIVVIIFGFFGGYFIVSSWVGWCVGVFKV